MANPITNKVKTGKIPVIKKELDDGVVAEANNDGTIYLDKDVKDGSPLAKEAIAHEMVHMDQMARGDLNYDDNNVYWKGKKYDRDDMNEGSKQLPWEAEAYQKTKNMKKSSPNKLNFGLSNTTLGQNAAILSDQLRAKADKHKAIGDAVGKVTSQVEGFEGFAKKNTNPNDQKKENVEGVIAEGESGKQMNLPMSVKNKNKSAMKMKANPITMKAKSSPLHVETTTTKEIKGVNYDTDDDGTDDAFGDVTETTVTKPGAVIGGGYEDKMSDEEWKKYLANETPDQKEKRLAREVKDGVREATTVDTSHAFTPRTEKVKKPGTPGTPDKYNMGYYESMDTKWGAGVRNRGRKKLGRILNREGKKFDKKGAIDPSTGKSFKSKDAYLKYVADSYGADYNIPVGKTRLGKAGTEGSESTQNMGVQEGSESYVKKDGKKTEENSSNPMNLKNKSKAPFKMKGFSGFNKN